MISLKALPQIQGCRKVFPPPHQSMLQEEGKGRIKGREGEGKGKREGEEREGDR